MTIIETLNSAESKLTEAGIEISRLDAEVLLAHTLACKRAEIYIKRNEQMTETELASFNEAIDKRSKGCPVAYITGVKEFWSLPIKVTKDVLIPRPETEIVVEEALRRIKDSTAAIQILDLCTGSGCIAAALASELPNARIVATDSSQAALNIAEKNLAFAKSRIELCKGDLFTALSRQDLPPLAPPYKGGGKTFDLITANPPYIAEEEFSLLARDIIDYEPRAALLAGKSGLDFITHIIENAPKYLKAGGWLIMETGSGQAKGCTTLAMSTDEYDTIATAKDLAGIERVIMLRKNLWTNS